MNDIRRKLEREDYPGVRVHLAGASIQKQLIAIMKIADSPGAVRVNEPGTK